MFLYKCTQTLVFCTLVAGHLWWVVLYTCVTEWYVSVHRSADGELSTDVSSLPGMDALDQPGMYRHTDSQHTPNTIISKHEVIRGIIMIIITYIIHTHCSQVGRQVISS